MANNKPDHAVQYSIGHKVIYGHPGRALCVLQIPIMHIACTCKATLWVICPNISEYKSKTVDKRLKQCITVPTIIATII